VYNGEESSDWKHQQFNVFYPCFIVFFNKSLKKTVFMFFICKSMFLTSMIRNRKNPLR